MPYTLKSNLSVNKHEIILNHVFSQCNHAISIAFLNRIKENSGNNKKSIIKGKLSSTQE